jgi:hypothetical protein
MCALLAFASCKKNEPVDEAKAAGLTTADFPQITADIFKPMDGGIDLCPEEITGRNTWNLWSGGNQRFWNRAAQDIQPVLLCFRTMKSCSASQRPHS